MSQKSLARPDIIRTTYTYTPYGEATATGDVTQPFTWSSEYADEELALIYYNYRHYNPADGRWINRDPIEEEGGWNLYAFVFQNPILYIDRIGLKYYLCIYTNCCKSKGASYMEGHVALALINTTENTITTYGLWPDFHEDIVSLGLNNGSGSDIRINFPNDNIKHCEYKYIHCKEITDKQKKLFDNAISENWTWRYTQTCASFASDVFYTTTGVDIDDDDFLGFETPRQIGDSILTANGGKNSNIDNPAEPNLQQRKISSS